MSETKPEGTASDPQTDPQGAPAFITVKSGPEMVMEGTKGLAVVTVDTDRDTPEIVHLRVNASPYDDAGCSVAVHVILPLGKAARKLRRLATFARDQGRLGPEMDVEDELRAMQVLAKTLDSLPDAIGFRVLSWLNSRHHTKPAQAIGAIQPPFNPPPPVSTEESVRMAKEHVTGERA